MPKPKPTTIAEYIASAPKPSQKKLREMYSLLKKSSPGSTEVIKWGMPMFEEKRILFAFAAFKSHINLMPTPSAIKPFKKELERFTTGKGSIQFPYDKPLPKALIRKIAELRVKDVRDNDARWM